jgi:hypothetical protein
MTTTHPFPFSLAIEKDIKTMLEKFPSLKEREPNQQKNWYTFLHT